MRGLVEVMRPILSFNYKRMGAGSSGRRGRQRLGLQHSHTMHLNDTSASDDWGEEI